MEELNEFYGMKSQFDLSNQARIFNKKFEELWDQLDFLERCLKKKPWDYEGRKLMLKKVDTLKTIADTMEEMITKTYKPRTIDDMNTKDED